MSRTTSSKGVNWPALLLGMTMPGLGQMVNGKLVKGISFFAIYEMIALIGLRWAVRLPDRLLMVGTGVTLLSVIIFYLWAMRDAAVTRREGEPRPYNRWYFYLATWLVGMVAVNGAVIAHIKSSTIEAFRIVAESMSPTVLRGDFVLTDKTAYRRAAPQVGDVVMFVNPDDRSKIFIRKIVALPGQKSPDGETVPHGMVYVLGEKPTAPGSATTGYIPLRDLAGKARQIYWSKGDAGVRLERIGMVVTSGR